MLTVVESDLLPIVLRGRVEMLVEAASAKSYLKMS